MSAGAGAASDTAALVFSEMVSVKLADCMGYFNTVAMGCKGEKPFICRQFRSGGGNAWRLLGGTDARFVFEMAGEVAWRLVTQTVRCFLDRKTTAYQLMGALLPLRRQPRLSVFAQVFEEMPVQGAHGDATLLGQG